MFAMFECVAQAVMGRGIRGLCEFVPGGPYLFDVMGDAYRLYREQKRAADLREEVVQIAAATNEQARRTAEEVVRKVAAEATAEERITLELYLTQIPAAVRQSMKRTDDPTGKTVPPDFAVNAPADLARLMPTRVPQFRPGADLPGRSGWRLDDLLGAGGFGEVWLARHTFVPNRRGAVKFCTDPLAKAKLVSHEGKVIARVMAHGDHPHVVPLLDAVLDGDTPWLMYEYVPGGDLTDLIHRWQTLPPAEREAAVVVALHQLAATVGTFHRLAPPLVHRDLKPSNILQSGIRDQELGVSKQEPANSGSSLTPDSRLLTPVMLRITDFGIGGVAVEYLRTHHPVGVSLMTGWLETALRGSHTPLYASPQQRAGQPPDPRDDVHALGVIGYQMMTGRLDQAPGIDAAEDLQDAGAGAELIALLTKCVAQKAERRPKDAAELAEKVAGLKPTQSAGPQTVAITKPAPRVPEGLGSSTPHPNPPPQGGRGPEKTAPPVGGKVAVQPPLPTSPPVGEVAAQPRGGGTSDPTPNPLPHGERGLLPAPPSFPGKGVGGLGSAAQKPSKWVVTVPGQWFTRPAGDPDAAWSNPPTKLPGEVTAKPGEAYRLALHPDRTTDAELAKLKALAGLPGLEAIDLSGCAQISDRGLTHLATVPGLKAVGLSDTPVTDAGVAVLVNRFPNLEAVTLTGTERVSPAVVPYLAKLRKLKLVALPPRADTVDVRLELTRRVPGCQVV